MIDAAAPKPEIVLIDLSGLFWRSWTSKGEVLNARDNTLALVRRCMEGVGFQAPTALCCDLGRSFRKDIAESYKATRPDKDLMALNELDKTREALANEGFVIWGAGGFEADDVIATATKLALAAGHPVRVASADKDLLQLLAFDGVTVLRTHNMSLWRKEDVIQKFGVPPYLLGDWLALVGDTSDNIAGVKGVGEVTATAFLTAFPGLGFLLDAAENGMAGKVGGIRGAANLAKAIAANAESIRLGRRLVELRYDAEVPFDEIFKPRERKRPADQPQQELSMSGPNEMSAGNELGAPESPAAPPATETTHAPPIAPQAAAQAATAPAAKAPEPAKSTALATTGPLVPEVFSPFERGLEPVNASQALNMAKTLWRSGLYGRFPNEEAIYAVITRGRELGISAAAALDVFHYMPEVGRVAPLAHLVAALVERDPTCEYLMCVETDATKATYEFKHRRHPRARTHTYTIEDAVQAGLCQMEPKQRDWTPDPKNGGKPGKDHRGPWDSRRPEMIRKSCVIQIGRIYFPAAALGLYAMEEFGYEEAA